MRVDTDDFARPRGCGKNHLVEVEKILIEPGAVNALEEAMSEGLCWMRMILRPTGMQ